MRKTFPLLLFAQEVLFVVQVLVQLLEQVSVLQDFTAQKVQKILYLHLQGILLQLLVQLPLLLVTQDTLL